MAIETVATHLADLRESRARSSEMESTTRERNVLLPGKQSRQTIDNETARFMLGELQKDEVLSDLVREKEIYTAAALVAHIEADPDAFLADMVGAYETDQLGNDLKMVQHRSDLVIGNLQPITEGMERIYSRLGEPGFDAAGDLRMLNSLFDRMTSEMHEFGLNDVEDREDGTQISRFPMLPGGAAQGEPLTLDHLDLLRTTTRVAQLHGDKTQARLLEQIKSQPSTADFYSVQKDEMTLLKDYKEQFKAALFSGFSGAYETNPEGKGGVRDHPDYASANEAMRNALAQIAMGMGDPASAINELTQMTQDTYQLHKDQIDTSPMIPFSLGEGGGAYNTYVPRNIDTYRGKKVEGNNTAQYIEKLEAYIAANAENQTPQQSADKFLAHNMNEVFSNMVTAPTK